MSLADRHYRLLIGTAAFVVVAAGIREAAPVLNSILLATLLTVTVVPAFDALRRGRRVGDRAAAASARKSARRGGCAIPRGLRRLAEEPRIAAHPTPTAPAFLVGPVRQAPRLEGRRAGGRPGRPLTPGPGQRRADPGGRRQEPRPPGSSPRLPPGTRAGLRHRSVRDRPAREAAARRSRRIPRRREHR